MQMQMAVAKYVTAEKVERQNDSLRNGGMG
jgi:hypothetical protein